MKNPLTPAGIEPATFPFVAQYLNYCAAAVPILHVSTVNDDNARAAFVIQLSPSEF